MVVLWLDSRRVRLDAAIKIIHHNTIMVLLSHIKFVKGAHSYYAVQLQCYEIIIDNVRGVGGKSPRRSVPQGKNFEHFRQLGSAYYVIT
jgi:hypothetical protein